MYSQSRQSRPCANQSLNLRAALKAAFKAKAESAAYKSRVTLETEARAFLSFPEVLTLQKELGWSPGLQPSSHGHSSLTPTLQAPLRAAVSTELPGATDCVVSPKLFIQLSWIERGRAAKQRFPNDVNSLALGFDRTSFFKRKNKNFIFCPFTAILQCLQI